MKEVNIKIKKTTKDIRCKCGGQVMVDAKMTKQVPLGFGFAPGSSKFQIDVVQFKGWVGNCLECNKRIFAWHTKKLITKIPKKINQKIALARK